MFSLYPTKNMTSGEGGMVAVSPTGRAALGAAAAQPGMQRRYENEIVGFNNRMTDLHAAIGRVQLGRLAAGTRYGARMPHSCRRISRRHRSHRRGRRDARFPPVHILVDGDAAERDRMARALAEEYGVGTGVYYPTPLHELPSLRRYAPRTEMARTLRAAAQCLSLPVHPGLSFEDLEKVVIATNAVVKAGA